MNRYAAAGLLAEAEEGKRILVVTLTSQQVHLARGECERLVDDPHARMQRANGKEYIHLTGGGGIFFHSYAQDVRGYSADIVYLDSGVDEAIRDLDKFDDYRRVVATSTTPEIVRA